MNGKQVEGGKESLLFAALAAAVGVAFGLVTLLSGHARAADSAGQVEPPRTVQPGNAVVSEGNGLRTALAPAATGEVIEVFANSWGSSGIGLVYDAGRQQVRYVHELQSAASTPTVYDVTYPAHAVVSSFALSAQNSGWPWQLDNRNGAGYDPVAGTFFLTDYSGDMAYADDNIVEVDAGGAILNAWEMDDFLGSNDSADGSAIDGIVDIAVVPGTGGDPPRYFAAALFDGPIVYEITLTKTGSWWTPDSWSTVMTYSASLALTFSDNVSIDYDSQNQVLYHSGQATTTILVTDLNMNPITTFDCPVPGGGASGVTFIEGSWPPEIWATHYTSNETARCEAVGEPPVQPEWGKWVGGEAWDPQAVVEAETYDVVQVTDVITAVQPFTLTETWNPDRLALVDWDIFPPVTNVVSGTASLQIVAPAGAPEVIQISKWFLVQPSTWSTTLLLEELVVEGGPVFAPRPVSINKQAPQLSLVSSYEAEVTAGTVVSFTLTYANNGGYENAVAIGSTFPNTAPFVTADPLPDTVGADGLTAEWRVGDLAQGDGYQIDVYVSVAETVPASSTIPIWNGIYNHLGQLAAESSVVFHAGTSASPVAWEKWVNGEPWQPGSAVTLETAETFLVEEMVDPAGNASGFSLTDAWNVDELALLPSWSVQPAEYGTYVSTGPGLWLLEVPAGVDFGPLSLVKAFRVEPSTAQSTILSESLEVWSGETWSRPVAVHRELSELWLGSAPDEGAFGGDLLLPFTLMYGNNGGRESAFKIRSNFASELTFVEAQPPPSAMGEEWIEWHFPGGLDKGEEGDIAVTLAVPPIWPVAEPIEIWNGILNYAGVVANDSVFSVHVPAPALARWVNGEPWHPDLGTSAPTGAMVTVTDVISTHLTVAAVERWNPAHLELVDVIAEPEAGEVTVEDDTLAWVCPDGGPGQMTLTRHYRLRAGMWTDTVLWDELWVAHELWARGPVHVERVPVLYLPLLKQ